ncbi:MAG: Raf kinase inhibitor-like protein YbhB/YbcL family [Planctomycetota bacterium]|nr:Raf kinase inhibitor-like protein YbhB/YbcL family [Planctomycetota bacterium]
MSLTVKTPAFTEGHPIPVAHTEDGDDRSPGLTWTAPPKGTAGFCLIVDDPDAPGEEPWVHWILANIPVSLLALPAGFHEGLLPADAPPGLIQGKNSWGTNGYRGPAPPSGHGTHHYHFKLYALDARLNIAEGIGKHDLLEMLSGHVLARGELVGTYRRD